MKLTSDDIRQLIKEELDKLLKESSKKEKIPMAVPEDWSEYEETRRVGSNLGDLKKRKEWRGNEDPHYNMAPCPEWIKNRYDYYAEQLKPLQGFSFEKYDGLWGGSYRHKKKVEKIQRPLDATIYFAARIYGCQWAKDLLKKWPDEKFRKFIDRLSPAWYAAFIAGKEAGFGSDGAKEWITKNFDPDLPRWGLPEAEWQDRREEAKGGDEEMGIGEVIGNLDARFRERMTIDPNWRNELRQYYDLLDNNRFEEFFFALDNEVGQEIFSHMIVVMGDELQEKLQEVTSFMKKNYPTFYKLLQGLEYL